MELWDVCIFTNSLIMWNVIYEAYWKINIQTQWKIFSLCWHKWKMTYLFHLHDIGQNSYIWNTPKPIIWLNHQFISSLNEFLSLTMTYYNHQPFKRMNCMHKWILYPLQSTCKLINCPQSFPFFTLYIFSIILFACNNIFVL